MKQILCPFKDLALVMALTLPAWVLPSFDAFAADAIDMQRVEKTSQLCTNETRHLEQREGIPAHLLTAISLAETGRWQKGARENLAWPWTVTAHGRGQHFETKEEALLEVEILMTEGVRNIDVGCMQINLKYHEDAFETLSEALDPKANTEYASRFLKRLYEVEETWMGAVGAYHSSTPERNLKYRAKLARIWGEAGGSLDHIETETASLDEATEVLEESVNLSAAANEEDVHRQIQDLNLTLYGDRSVGTETSSAPGGRFLSAAMQRHDQINSWRQRQLKNLDAQHMAAMQLAEQRLR